MKQKYRGECGQCDFVANSALKMEQHLRTHGIVLSGSVAEDEPPVPQPKKRRKRKRMGPPPKVKHEPKEQAQEPVDEIDSSLQSAEVQDKPSIKTEVVEDDVPVENASDNCHLLFTEGMPCHADVEVKTEEVLSDNGGHASEEIEGERVQPIVPCQPETSLSELTVIGSATTLDLNKVKEEPQDPIDLPLENDESELHLTLSDADTSNNSGHAMDDIVDTSATLSANETSESDVNFNIHGLDIKKEMTDSSYDAALQNMLSTTPVRKDSSSCTAVTPPDHDYIKTSPESANDCIPDGLKEEFMMNCVSIKQEEFEQMNSPSSHAESKVIVIAPQGDQNQMDELCSFIEANSNPPRNEYLDSNKNLTNLMSEGKPGPSNAYSPSKAGEIDATKATKLIRTSVLRSILRGEVAPPVSPPKEEPKPVKGRKMYSLPCTFTIDGKLRLVPAASNAVSHYIVVSPATPGNSPCLYLVAKAKVQTLVPNNKSNDLPKPKSKPKKAPVKRQLCPSSPSTNLKKARSKLDNVLSSQVSESKLCAKIPSPQLCAKIPSPHSVSNALMRKIAHEVVPQVPVAVEESNLEEKIFVCRKQFCDFSTKQYYAYQSHVMHCWENHGFLVCDIDFCCGGHFRTKSTEEFEHHCMTVHNCLMLHSCSKCMFLGTQDSHIHQHYAMYHRDLYAPESPFPSKSHPTQRFVRRSPKANAIKDNIPHGRVTTVLVTKPPLPPAYPDAPNPNPGQVESTEKSVSLALGEGMAGITNAMKHVSQNSNNIPNSACGVSDRISVTIAPTHIQSPKKVKCSQQTSQMVNELISQMPKPSTTDVKEVCYSAKKLEETLEPATKVLTQTVKSKCLRDLEYSIQKNSPSKEVHIHIYAKDEPENQASKGHDNKIVNFEIKKEPGTETELFREIPNPSQPTETLGQKDSRDAQTTPEKISANDSTSSPKVKVAQEISNPETQFEEEFLDGTVDESFVFDELDQNAEDISGEKLTERADDSNVPESGGHANTDPPSQECTSSPKPKEDPLPHKECTLSPPSKEGPSPLKECSSSPQPKESSVLPQPKKSSLSAQPGDSASSTKTMELASAANEYTTSLQQKKSTASSCPQPKEVASTSNPAEGKVERLILEDAKGGKSEVLLQPAVAGPLPALPSGPRQSGRARKRKDMSCNQSCCVNKKKRRMYRMKGKTEVVKYDSNLDVKLLNKPVVVLIDIMRLVKPMLGLESPAAPVTYSRKQTARKSTSRRSRVRKNKWTDDYYYYY